MAGIFFKSKRKALILACFGGLVLFVFSFLNADQRDRYLSIIDSNTKNASTAEGRTDGLFEAFNVALRKPIFGHGIGTSREVNANFGTEDKPAHNLYAELAQEMGIVGLVIFMLFIKTIITNFSVTIRRLTATESYLVNFVNAMQVWLIMNIIFSFASYGVSSYEWYLFAGLSAVLSKLSLEEQTSTERKQTSADLEMGATA
jgi:O-antigen ligase